MTQKRRNEITGLRGLSACAIAYIFHYTELFHTMPERFPIQAAVMGFLARYGVCMSEIFFMLSGLLLYWSYQKRLSEGELRLGSFILPKMKKIYPMMMASALVTWLLQKVGYAIYGVYILHPDGAGVRNSLKALSWYRCWACRQDGFLTMIRWRSTDRVGLSVFSLSAMPFTIC